MNRIRVTINGTAVEAEVAPRTHLADFLRERLNLTGTHIGCEHGICGACTVEIDGEIARACITYAVACDGTDVRTIEGFDDDALMGRLREAFTKNHALQCGYCTPGMLVAARDLVRRKSGLTRAQIRTEMSGNLCRCTGYVGIVNAIEGVMRTEPSTAAMAPGPNTGWLGPAPGPGKALRAVPPNSQVSSRGLSPGSSSPPGWSSVARWIPAINAGRALGTAGPATRRAPIAVSVGAISEADGATQLTQSFVLPHPRAAVWELMADPFAIAACMPGMTLDPPRPDGALPGRMEIALGPIKASFSGLGTVQTFAHEFRQVIEGRGGDRRSGSQATGKVDYRLVAEGADATRVDVAISYVLAGPLAQVGRSAIVGDLVRRVGETFAQNIDARLSGGDAPPAQALGGLTLLMHLARDRVRALLRSLTGGRG